jgi:hypothetical protein
MINDWDSARREIFLEALVEFPAYSSVEQTEVVLELRPWVAQSYTAALMNNLGETPSSGPTSVEAWLFEYAEDHGLPIQALENPLRTWKAQDAMSQERSLLELEELILIRPDAEVVARASRMLLESGYEDWAEGRAVTDPFLFAREIGAPADGWGYQLNEDLGTLMYEWREDIWIETLDEILQQRTDVDTLFVSAGFAHLHTEEKPFPQDLQDERWELIHQWP